MRQWGIRSYVILVSVLLISSTLASLIMISTHGRIKVGIVLVDDCDSRFAVYAKEGLDRYDDYLSTEILDTRFNASHIGIVGDLYLADDFNSPEYTKTVRDGFGVDLVLIITDHPRGGVDEILYSYWGKANTESASAVMTVWFYMPESEFDWTEKEWKGWDRQYTQSVAVHEVGHLLGYKHDIYDDKCVMMFGSHNPEYCTHHSMELPYRTYLAPLGYGKDFHAASFLINSVLAALFLPFLISLSIIIHLMFSKFLYSAEVHAWPSIATNSVLAYFVLMVANSVVSGLVVALTFALLVEILFFLWRGWKSRAEAGEAVES
ncbi:MAG: hypothetical protein JSW28_01850 [Thermoplasmata archaeon]|nr:MAG: hypothetical protein JSW28_01850 [Thermoplasmata archaeon]